jgi:hypothetical protein
MRSSPSLGLEGERDITPDKLVLTLNIPLVGIDSTIVSPAASSIRACPRVNRRRQRCSCRDVDDFG